MREANETLDIRLKETWCYLIYPVQESAQSDVEWTSSKVPTQDGLLSRASKILISEEGLLPELGPARLDRELQKYIWNDKPHLNMKELWEYMNRYTYLPRVKNRGVLAKTVHSAVSGMLPGPFAYADRWDEDKQAYIGLAVSGSASTHVVIDGDAVIVKPNIAEAVVKKTKADAAAQSETTDNGTSPTITGNLLGTDAGTENVDVEEKLPTRFQGAVMIASDRPAKEIHRIIEAIVEQLTTLPHAEVMLKLEIDAEVSSGLDRAKVRTLLENATTLGFIDKKIQ